MASIINGPNLALPSQHRTRVLLSHSPTTCDVYFDFALNSGEYTIHYTVDGSHPTSASAAVLPRATAQVGYSTQVKAVIVRTADGVLEYPDSVWTPPIGAVNFNFSFPAFRPSCSIGDCDVRYHDGNVYVYTTPVSRKHAIAVMFTRDTGTICQDVGMFYSTDGSDPDPCPVPSATSCDPGLNECIAPGATLLNALFNYEVITVKIGQPVWIVARPVSTQSGTGGCVESNCVESIDGGAWLA